MQASPSAVKRIRLRVYYSDGFKSPTRHTIDKIVDQNIAIANVVFERYGVEFLQLGQPRLIPKAYLKIDDQGFNRLPSLTARMQKIIDVFYVQKLSSSQRSIFGRSRKDLGRTYAWISIAAAIFARESGTDVPVEAPPEEVLAHELAHILTELGQVGLDIVGEKRNLLSADGASLGRLDRSPLTTQEARRLISFYNYLELNTDQKRRMQTVLPNFVER